MMKDVYIVPTMTIVSVKIETVMGGDASPVNTVTSNAGLSMGGSGNGNARSKERGGDTDIDDLW